MLTEIVDSAYHASPTMKASMKIENNLNAIMISQQMVKTINDKLYSVNKVEARRYRKIYNWLYIPRHILIILAIVGLYLVEPGWCTRYEADHGYALEDGCQFDKYTGTYFNMADLALLPNWAIFIIYFSYIVCVIMCQHLKLKFTKGDEQSKSKRKLWVLYVMGSATLILFILEETRVLLYMVDHLVFLIFVIFLK
jgi:hypothetical protein